MLYFVNIVPNLAIEIDQQYLSNVFNTFDPVEKAIKKYQKHPVTADDISKEIKRFDIKKATQESDIPTKVISYKAISKPLYRLLTQKY